MDFVRWDDEGVTIEMPDAPWLMNGLGTFHGGALSALCDTAAGAAVVAAHGPGCGAPSTIAMTVQYQSSATGRLRAEARCTKRGRQISFAEVTVTDRDGKVVARALVSVAIAPPRSPA
jgi:uncharacterized protein (TIGR00369 family)